MKNTGFVKKGKHKLILYSEFEAQCSCMNWYFFSLCPAGLSSDGFEKEFNKHLYLVKENK